MLSFKSTFSQMLQPCRCINTTRSIQRRRSQLWRGRCQSPARRVGRDKAPGRYTLHGHRLPCQQGMGAACRRLSKPGLQLAKLLERCCAGLHVVHAGFPRLEFARMPGTLW